MVISMVASFGKNSLRELISFLRSERDRGAIVKASVLETPAYSPVNKILIQPDTSTEYIVVHNLLTQ